MFDYSEVPQFLSCLCGRNRIESAYRHRRCFLSCLCGRNPEVQDALKALIFLSCLCGRNRIGSQYYFPGGFLSCLCGRNLF